MPMRHGRPGAASPAHCTSPPPLTLWSGEPASRSMTAACSTAQPLTSPDGSNPPPGRIVKYPPLSTAISAHKASTSASSDAQSASSISPRPYRLTSLSSR